MKSGKCDDQIIFHNQLKLDIFHLKNLSWILTDLWYWKYWSNKSELKKQVINACTYATNIQNWFSWK